MNSNILYVNGQSNDRRCVDCCAVLATTRRTRGWNRLVLLALLAGVSGALAAADDPMAAAVGALAEIDSLLAIDGQEAALARATHQYEALGDDPVLGWQFAQRAGLALLQSGRPAEAVPWFEAAIRGAPYEATNHRDLAATLMALGRRGRALSEYQEAVELAPGDPRMHLDYGQALTGFGFYEDAARELELADRYCGACVAAARALAALYLAKEDHAAALIYLQRLHAAEPSRQVSYALAQALLATGNAAAAAELLATLPAEELTAPEVMLALKVDRSRGNSDRARQWSRPEGRAGAWSVRRTPWLLE
jgi:tetratricopeptide (TPR) repeat protein